MQHQRPFIPDCRMGDASLTQPGKLAQDIEEWCRRELRFNDKDIPQLFNIREVCRGNMIPIWKFLIRFVYHPAKVEIVKKNLKLSGVKVQQALEEERKKRQQLIREIENVKSTINEIKSNKLPSMEDEIETLRRKIKELQQSLDKKRKERQKESQENYLMKAFDEQCKHNISIINEYNSRLNSNCTNLRNLKSVNINQIRKVMEDRLNKSFNLFKKNPTMGFQEMDFNNLQFDTEYLNNVPQFLDFICDIYKENLINLRHFSENVMTNQKAGKERVMEVEKLLELERRNHIYRFTETESLSKSAEEIRRTYEKQNESLSEMTRSTAGDKSVYIDELRRKEIELCQFRVVRVILEEYIASLTQDREEKKLIRQHMIQKQQDIHKLKEFRKAKYEKIQQLFSECDRIVRNYTKQKEYIKRFITEKIPPLAEPFASIMETLGNIMENECNLACKIPLDYLIHTECGEKRVLRKDLSIFVQDDLGTALKELTKSLHFSEYKAIEYLLPHVMNMKKELTSLENEKANMTELITHMQAFEQQLGEDVVQQIIEDNTELEQTQKEHWLPLIERTRQECEEFKSEAENVHTLSEVWLNNPVVKEIDWKEIISMNSKK